MTLEDVRKLFQGVSERASVVCSIPYVDMEVIVKDVRSGRTLTSNDLHPFPYVADFVVISKDLHDTKGY
jgi:hypothetical protein